MSKPIPGDYDPWWDVTTVWTSGDTVKTTIRRSQVAVYLVSLPPRYLAAFSAAPPPDSEPLDTEEGHTT